MISASRAPAAGRSWLVVPLALAALELTHPTWATDTVLHAVLPVADWWILLHALLVALFSLLALHLYRELNGNSDGLASAVRLLLGVFAVSNAAYLAIDGLGTGLVALGAAQLDPAGVVGVDRALTFLWESATLGALANLTGAAWLLALIGWALVWYPDGRAWVVAAGLGVTVIGVVVGTLGGIPLASEIGHVAAIFSGAVMVYRLGVRGIPFALLVFSAVLPQHVGLPAASGMLCLFLALLGRNISRGDSRLTP